MLVRRDALPIAPHIRYGVFGQVVLQLLTYQKIPVKNLMKILIIYII